MNIGVYYIAWRSYWM